MTQAECLNQVTALLEMEPGSLSVSDRLADLAGWNSLAVVALIAFLDETFELLVPAAAIARCQTVGDLIALAGDRVQS